MDDLNHVFRVIHSLVEWKRLGLQLGLLYPTLEKIDREQHGRIDDCIMEMLSAWLQRKDNVSLEGIPSWSMLKDALNEIGEKELADKINKMVSYIAEDKTKFPCRICTTMGLVRFVI